VDPSHPRAAARVYIEYRLVLNDADLGDLLLRLVKAMRENAA
jgi:hypothetical protein